MRPHLSLDVQNVGASVQFYRKVFGVSPQKQTADYAKFDLTAPSLNFSLVAAGDRPSSVNHLGIEVESLDEMAAWRQRLQQQSVLQKVEENTACCFARQDKLWFTDPDGNAWEVFIVREQLDLNGPLSQTGCCVPKSQNPLVPVTCAAAGDRTPTGPFKMLLLAIVLWLGILLSPVAWAESDRDSAFVPPGSTATPVVAQNPVLRLPADPAWRLCVLPPNASRASRWPSRRAISPTP